VTTLESLRQRKAEIERLARAHGARDVRIFGSVARNEDAEDSDIDVLVDMSDEASLLDLVQLQQALEVMLDRRADVLTVRAINPHLRERILAEAVPL
jgi:predicted nucleotidyltransferase